MDIQCVGFELRSSQAVQRLRLNERVRFAVTTRFSCEGLLGAGELGCTLAYEPRVALCGAIHRPCCMYVADGIRSTTEIQADIDPPAPFSYLPASVLTSVGEAAVRAALANLQASAALTHAGAVLCMLTGACRVPGKSVDAAACPCGWQRTFINSLARDYARWATDPRCRSP